MSYRVIEEVNAASTGYMVNGKMTDVLGVVTFLLDQNGVIYEKDLGLQMAEVVKAMAGYDPDKTSVVSEAPDVETAAESTDDQQ